MRAAVAIGNLILGTVYTSYGLMTLADMKRGWKQFGFSHFGAAWVAMAFTCGPHHLFHGIHAAFEGRPGGGLDVFVVVVGLPAGAAWMALRVEAFVGGRGDRFIAGTPVWVAALPTMAAVYVTALAFGIVGLFPLARFDPIVTPNMLLVVIYVTIGYFLLRTQLRNRPAAGGWSVSGLSLGIVFPTCALMHLVFALYTTTGLYSYDVHGFTIDWLAVPAGLYFLWVVRSLYLGELHDWNEAPVEISQPDQERVSR